MALDRAAALLTLVPNGTVWVLKDGTRKKLIEGLTAVWHRVLKDFVYVAETTSLKRYPTMRKQ